MRRSILAAVKGCAMFAVMVLVLSPASASAQQTVNFTIGGFVPRGEDSRSPDDVLVNNRDFLSFNIKDFNGATIGGEWLTNVSDMFEAGLGLGFYQRTSPAVYTRFVNADGSEIEQDLKLRVVPFTATVRFLPLGHHGIEPYVGAGVGVFNWRYSETGQFLATDRSIFRDSFVGSGNATGPVILGGVRIPVGSWGVGGELRYQKAEGKMPLDQDFSGSRIDLGGLTYNFTIHVRF
jgi:opacity protein-like surface antigen